MVSFKDFLPRNRLAAARAVTRLLETATATVGDLVTIPAVARLPHSTRKHQEAAIGGRLSPAWQYSDEFGSAFWPARMGARSRNTRGRNHTQDDLQAVEMLHSNPKDIPKPTSLLGNLSHEELSATPFFRYYHHVSAFLFFFFLLFNPTVLHFPLGSSDIYLDISYLLPTNHDDTTRFRCYLTFLRAAFSFAGHHSVSLFSAMVDVAILSACSDFLPLTFSGGLLDAVTRCIGF